MRPPRRRSILALLGAAAAAAAAVPIIAFSAPDSTRAPDLRADPVESIDQPAVYLGIGGIDTSDRLLVRFDGFVTNVGTGPLEIRGNPQSSGADGVKQYALADGQNSGDIPSAVVGTPEVKYELADSHNHFHLKRAMEYSLWNASKTAQVAPGQKVGFCLYDSGTAPSPSPPPVANLYNQAVTDFCDNNKPNATSLRMGVGSGRRDIYNKALSYQWVDVSATAPGTYYVASLADPGNQLWEVDSNSAYGGHGENNTRTFASTPVTVPGYVAKPATVTQTTGPQVITLTAGTVGANLGGRVNTIVTPPAHGALSALTATSVTYTPAAGYSGADSFSFSSRDANSSFPTAGSEPTATVQVLAAGPSVAISGAPQILLAGTSAQLSATLSGTGGGVSWSTTAGSITPGGLLTAPPEPPESGALTVRATSVLNPSVTSQVVIGIAPVPVAQPAPLPTPVPPAVTPASSTKLLSRLSVGHVGPRVVVGTITTGPKAGRVDVIVSYRTKVLGRCGARVGARRTVSCRIVMPRAFALSRVRVTARLSILGRTQSVRRAFVQSRAAGTL